MELGQGSETLTRNSVLLVPDLLNRQERRLLVDATEECAIDAGKALSAKLRISVMDSGKRPPGGLAEALPCGLGRDSAALWKTILDDRYVAHGCP